jgi:hypothetical protein
MSRQTEPRAHHYLPQRYLKGLQQYLRALGIEFTNLLEEGSQGRSADFHCRPYHSPAAVPR